MMETLPDYLKLAFAAWAMPPFFVWFAAYLTRSLKGNDDDH